MIPIIVVKFDGKDKRKNLGLNSHARLGSQSRRALEPNSDSFTIIEKNLAEMSRKILRTAGESGQF